MYAKYPDGTVKGTITVREDQALPSPAEAVQELMSYVPSYGIPIPVVQASGAPVSANATSGTAMFLANTAGTAGAAHVPAEAPNSTHHAGALPPVERIDLEDMLSRAIKMLENGPLSKVVLSWKRSIATPVPLPPFDVLVTMRTHEPAGWLLAHITPESAFVGITPELILSRWKSTVESLPIAGTIAPRMAIHKNAPYATSLDTPQHESPDESLETILFKSAKDRLEHKITVDEVVSAFNRFCRSVHAPPEPEILRLSSVIHLQSPVSGQLLPELDVPSTTLKLLQELHPTPAVAGVPRKLALETIAALEKDDRGPYAGITGWIAQDGNGCFVLNIRTATITGSTVQFQAGAGLVKSSDPRNEAREIEAKLESIATMIRCDER
jgi:isochorismate synthase EntC